MVVLLLANLVCSLSAKSSMEQRLAGAWEIDVVATENYLRANKVLSEPVIERMRPKLAALRLVYDEAGVAALGSDGAPLGHTETAIVASTKNKTVFTTVDQAGKKTTTWLVWDDGGFWQETSAFPRYKERFVRSKIKPISH